MLALLILLILPWTLSTFRPGSRLVSTFVLFLWSDPIPVTSGNTGLTAIVLPDIRPTGETLVLKILCACIQPEAKKDFCYEKKINGFFLTKNSTDFFSRKKILSSVSNTGYNTTVATLYAYSIFIFQGQAKLESVPFQLAPPPPALRAKPVKKKPNFQLGPPSFLSPRLLT